MRTCDGYGMCYSLNLWHSSGKELNGLAFSMFIFGMLGGYTLLVNAGVLMVGSWVDWMQWTYFGFW